VEKFRKDGNFNYSNLIDYIQEKDINVNRDEFIELISKDYGAGQSYTPNNIAILMAEIGKTFQPKTILDPACGIGNSLSFCNYANSIEGYDTNAETIKIAKFLNNEANYIQSDFLQKPMSKKYDLIVSDFPFGGRYRREGIAGHYEKLFLDKCLDLINNNGGIICIVPNNFLYAPYTDTLRRKILDKFSLELIVNLPRGVLHRTNIETSVLLIQKKKQRDSVYLAFYDENSNEIINNYQNEKGEIWVNKGKLGNRWDRHFHDPKFNEIDEKLRGKDVKLLSEMSEIKRGFLFRREHRKKDGKYLIYSNRNIKDNKFVSTDRDNYADEIGDRRFADCILQEGDIVVSLIFDQRKLYIYRKHDPLSVISQNFAIIRSHENEYLKTYLSSESGKQLFRKQADRKSRGTTISHLTINDLSYIKIPVLPLDDLNAIYEDNLIKSSKTEIELIREQLKRQQTSDDIFKQEVLDRLERIENKVDLILGALNSLQNDIEVAKSLKRNDEEKLKIIYAKIDNKLSSIKEQLKDDIAVYEEIAKDLIENWDKLDILSKEILPIAEYLLDKLKEIKDADYSPVILEYCKSLENEILKKLFIEFTLYINKKHKNIDEFFVKDFENDKTSKFVKYIKRHRGKNSEDIKYTLGDMSFILNLTAGERTIQQSLLLQKFRLFIAEHFKAEFVLSKEYLKRVEAVINNFRNKCAHPYKLTETDAIKCKEQVPDDINYFINYWNEEDIYTIR